MYVDIDDRLPCLVGGGGGCSLLFASCLDEREFWVPLVEKAFAKLHGGYGNLEVFILFYFILFYFILFYFILFYFILFYFILFYFILFYFILFYFILFYFILFYF